MFAYNSMFIRQTWQRVVPGLTLLLVVVGLNNVSAEESLAVALVEQRVTPKLFVADAVIEAVHQATLAAETTGRIKQILFDVDDLVEKGAILLRFTDKEQQADVARASAQLKEALARLQQAEDEHKRIQSVFEKKLVAKSAVDKTLADVKAARQRVKAAEADDKKAREQLEYTIVRAPYAGIVVKRHVNVGERVQAGTPLMTGFSLAKLRATASVPQTVVEAVRQHGKVTISLNGTVGGEADERANTVSSDKLTVYPYADPTTHDFTVRAELASVPAGFYPGMFAKARFVVGQITRLLVPASAVVHRSEVTALYVVDKQGRVEFRAVRVGAPADDTAIEILAGLSVGEQVALDPVKAGVLLKAQRAQ
jgi:RND family efflux transporter MFP subunit